jgi:hypothetical protein
MDFINHPACNHSFGAPTGWDQNEQPVGTLPVSLGWIGEQRVMHSFWKPNDRELAKLLQGRPVILTIFGQVHPIVAVGVEM